MSLRRPAFGYKPRPASNPHRGVAYARGLAASPVVDPDLVLDLRPLAPPARAQGALGSCTGFAGRGAVMALIEASKRDGLWRGADFDASPLAIYSEERYLDGTLALDEGSTISRLVEVLGRAIPREDRWPYDPRLYTRRAPAAAWSEHALVNATPLRHDLDDIRAAFADGCPVVVGIPCYTGSGGITSAAAWDYGRIEMPRVEDDIDGWHAVTLFGHDPHANRENGGVCWVQNSWGGWAPRTNGIGTIPAAYITQLANELYAFGAVR